MWHPQRGAYRVQLCKLLVQGHPVHPYIHPSIQADGQTNGQTDGQTNGWTIDKTERSDQQANIPRPDTDRPTNRQTDQVFQKKNQKIPGRKIQIMAQCRRCRTVRQMPGSNAPFPSAETREGTNQAVLLMLLQKLALVKLEFGGFWNKDGVLVSSRKDLRSEIVFRFYTLMLRNGTHLSSVRETSIGWLNAAIPLRLYT